jgi:hypothetical protein
MRGGRGGAGHFGHQPPGARLDALGAEHQIAGVMRQARQHAAEELRGVTHSSTGSAAIAARSLVAVIVGQRAPGR